MKDAENNEIDTSKLTSAEKRELFLEELSCSGNITKACEKSGLERAFAYRLKEKDDVFGERWDRAKELGVEALEDEARRRAMDGVVRSTKHGIHREFSDTLTIFLLKAAKPEIYSERIRNEITGAGGAPLNLAEDKIAIKLDAILKTAQSRRASAETPEAEDDFDDLC